MITYRAMKYKDIDEAINLWTSIEELQFSSKFDNKDRILKFLKKNKSLSTVAISEGKIIGALLCGSDGRRGFIYHTGVDKKYRRKHIAKDMVERSIKALKENQIDSCFLFTNDNNHNAQDFWKAIGFNYAPNVMYHFKQLN